jgi:hypothetical protein
MVQHTKTGKKFPNDHKIDQMAKNSKALQSIPLGIGWGFWDMKRLFLTTCFLHRVGNFIPGYVALYSM